jgi:AcrR family transcriptional regulator
LPPLVLKGIVCGVERVTRRRLLAGTVRELPPLAEELLAWALSYRSAAAAELLLQSPARREPSAALNPGARVDDDRARMLLSAARIAAARGYAQLSPGQIAHAAGVPEARFNELFVSAEQCFLDALDRIALEALLALARPGQARGDRGVGLYHGMLALMRHLAADPCLARLAFVEIFAVGPAGIERRERLLGEFTKLLSRSMPRSPGVSDLVSEASAGAIWGIVHHHVTRGAARALPMAAGHATYMALAPVLGADAAVEIIARAGADAQAPPPGMRAGL